MDHLISLYVPRMKSNYNKKDITEIIYNYFVDKHRLEAFVYDVDFVSINPTRSFFSDAKGNYKAAFIYMNLVCRDNDQVLIDILNGKTEKIYLLNPHLLNAEYWLISNNNNPIQRTNLNIHQIVNFSQSLEESVLKQQKYIKQLEENMNKLIDHITNNCPLTNNEMNEMKKNLNYSINL